MKGRICKAQVGAARDVLLEMGSNAEVRHVAVGTGFEVVTAGLDRSERRRIENRLLELGILVRQGDSENE